MCCILRPEYGWYNKIHNLYWRNVAHFQARYISVKHNIRFSNKMDTFRKKTIKIIFNNVVEVLLCLFVTDAILLDVMLLSH